MEYSSWDGVVWCVLMFELLPAGPLFRRRGLCREKQLLLRFSRGRSRQLKLFRASLVKQGAESAGWLFLITCSSTCRSTLPKTCFVSREATAFEIFQRGVSPAEAVPGESRVSERGIEESTIFPIVD